MSHIILYADDFNYDVWKEYCEICGVHPSAISITIIFDDNDVKAYYDEEDYDDEDEEEDEDEDEEEYVPSAENGDYSPSNPWDAPGMSINDFI